MPDAEVDGTADDGPAPVFVLGTGWRTGSTLVQRILMSDRRLLLWGEPLGRFGLLTRLAEAVCGVTPGWPPPESRADSIAAANDLTTAWIANLFPPAEDFRHSLRAQLERWLAAPAKARGFVRWGFKEVRLGAPEAVLLRWIFPAARFVVVTREPSAAYRSVKGSAPDWRLYARWPDRRVDDVVSFARHWDLLASGWNRGQPSPTPFVVRYEDLTAANYDFGSLARAGDLELAPARALAARVGATGRPARLSALDRLLLRRETLAGRRAMGYS